MVELYLPKCSRNNIKDTNWIIVAKAFDYHYEVGEVVVVVVVVALWL